MKNEIDLNRYLSNPDKCPFCGGSNITGGDADFDSIKAWRNIQCLSCKEEWTEEFTITNVQVVPEDL